MKRRDFLKKTALATGAFALNNIPVRSMASTSLLQKMAASSDNDKVLVILQLHGGNDGLNTIIPIEQYTDYLELRPNIALPFSGAGNRNLVNLDPSLDLAQQVGIHPDMGDLRYLYDEGKARIVQAVAYENTNQSHFRSRDIFFMGGGYDDNLNSGWLGRYLVDKYPGYPDAYPNPEMPDPLSLEIGNGISLAFHTPDTIPASLSLRNPQQFFNLINGVVGAEGVPDGLNGSLATPPDALSATKYAEEVRWIMEFESKSDEYAGRLKDVYLAGNNSNVNYPELYPFTAPAGDRTNPLSGQLKLIARLLSGGVKTKVFLARIGGFDTHAFQVEPSATTFGSHAAKLYHIFSSVRAFQDDLKALGLEERVLTLTLSEFGRRAKSNNSWGTDHGKAAPMFIFGKGVKGGVTGENPDLKNLDGVGNVPFQYDYRQVFNEVLEDWFCATPSEKTAVNFDQEVALPKLGILKDPLISTNDFYETRYKLETCIPNPVIDKTVFKYKINRAVEVTIKIYNSRGILVKTLLEEHKMPGEYHVKANLESLENGSYFYTLKAGSFTATKQLIKQ